jgi:hypothetical protein
VAAVLKELALYCSVDRIYVAENQAASHLEARAVVFHMRSPFHKRDAMVKVKQYLTRHQVREAAVRDCFPSAVMEVARNLNRYGGHLKRSQGIQRYRVIADRDGHPVLQTAKQGAGYTDHPVSVAEMEAFLASLGGSATQQAKQTTRGKLAPTTGPKTPEALLASRDRLLTMSLRGLLGRPSIGALTIRPPTKRPRDTSTQAQFAHGPPPGSANKRFVVAGGGPGR